MSTTAYLLVVCNCGHVNFEHAGEDEDGRCFGSEYVGPQWARRFAERRLVICPCAAFRPATVDEYLEWTERTAYERNVPTMRPILTVNAISGPQTATPGGVS